MRQLTGRRSRREPVSRALRAAIFCAVGGLVAPAPAPAASVDLGAGLRIETPLASMKDLRDRNLVRQRYDYSCGAAALATILRYHLGDERAGEEAGRETAAEQDREYRAWEEQRRQQEVLDQQGRQWERTGRVPRAPPPKF